MKIKIEWDKDTLPSEVLRQILDQLLLEDKIEYEAVYPISYAIGKAQMLEYLHQRR